MRANDHPIGSAGSVIFVLQGSLGDQICQLPAMVALRERYKHLENRDTYVVADPRVHEIIPQYTWLKGRDELALYGFRPGHEPEEFEYHVAQINVWDAVKNFGKDEHPTRMFFRYLGLDDPGDVVQPEIVVDESAPAYDYVIAPFANDSARAMPWNLLRDMLYSMSDAYGPFNTVASDGGSCVIGSSKDFMQTVTGSSIEKENKHENTWHYYMPHNGREKIDLPLSYIAGLMRNARKAVITVDSMPNRLAHAVGVENHVLLCSDVVPGAWATHPGARVLYGPPDSWTVDKVLELLPA